MKNKFLIKERVATEYGSVCKHCGHRILITNKYERLICPCCGYMIYRNKKIEFNYKIKEIMRKCK